MSLLLLSLAMMAPVPKDRAPAPEVVPGRYSLVWICTDYAAEFDADGEFREQCEHGFPWVGVWQWDAATRTLSIAETNSQGAAWLRWKVVLDKDLVGKTDGGVPVRLKPVPVMEKDR